MVIEELPEPTYCTPDDVADVLGLPDPNDPLGQFRFSDVSVPSYSYVCKLILGVEDELDRRLGQAWRENRVVDHVTSIKTYEGDRNGWRMEMYRNGGEYIQLHKDALPLDPTKGDRLWFRTLWNAWVDVTDIASSSPDAEDYKDLPASFKLFRWWMDPEGGRLFLRSNPILTPHVNAVRITYRWGQEKDENGENHVPYGINRLASLMVAKKIVVMDVYAVKVGSGGDISGTRQALLREWDAEIGNLMSSYQRSGSVHSLLRGS